MSSQSPFFPQDVALSNDMDAWFCMLNSMVNFLSAASTLATKLEQNYLLSNVTELKRPAYPLLHAPPSRKKIEHMHIAETNVKSGNNVRFLEQTFPSPSQPESEDQGETSNLIQEVRYMNTKDKGDGASIDSGEGDIECNSIEEEVVQSVANDTISYGDQFEETIKICNSEDTIYFDDISDSERTVHYQEPSNQLTEIHINENINHSPSVEKDEYCSASSSFLENKYVQAKCKNNDNLSRGSTGKVKSIKSEEIQTNSTCRFKSTVRALITKSPELQQSIKDSITCHSSSTYDKAPKMTSSCKHSAVPKNLNELKEQLDSIKNKSNSKTSVNETKPKCQKSKIPVDKTNLRKPRKIEKQSSNSSNANSCPNNVPSKSPGTSNRFASVESVVKKLIHSKVTEKKTDEMKENEKTCGFIQKNVSKYEKPEGSKQSIARSPAEHVEKKLHLPKDCKVVKDFIYKKPATHKSEKSKFMNEQRKPCLRTEPCRKQYEALIQNQSRTASLRSSKDSSTTEMLKKKEKGCKRNVSPNKVIKEKEYHHDVRST